MKKPLRVYVIGPYSQGDVVVNVRRAIEAGNNLRALGFSPYIPHLTHFWHMLFPHDYEYWMELDSEWLEVCDAAFLLPGPSSGAEREVKQARELGLPVFDNFTDLMIWKLQVRP